MTRRAGVGRRVYIALVAAAVAGAAAEVADFEGRIDLPRAIALWPAPRAEEHFAPAENLEAIDVEMIGSARETIDVAAYVLTDVPVIEALTSAARRGVMVRIYRSRGDFAGSEAMGRAIERLTAEPSVEIRVKKSPVFMHLKRYCIDGVTLRGGAANFSASGLTAQDNDLTIARGAGVCARFEREFEAMWDGGK